MADIIYVDPSVTANYIRVGDVCYHRGEGSEQSPGSYMVDDFSDCDTCQKAPPLNPSDCVLCGDCCFDFNNAVVTPAMTIILVTYPHARGGCTGSPDATDTYVFSGPALSMEDGEVGSSYQFKGSCSVTKNGAAYGYSIRFYWDCINEQWFLDVFASDGTTALIHFGPFKVDSTTYGDHTGNCCGILDISKCYDGGDGWYHIAVTSGLRVAHSHCCKDGEDCINADGDCETGECED